VFVKIFLASLNFSGKGKSLPFRVEPNKVVEYWHDLKILDKPDILKPSLILNGESRSQSLPEWNPYGVHSMVSLTNIRLG
jgi:hypothetical protein